jgi:hypothetical protein
MTIPIYSSLLQTNSFLCERKKKYAYLTERHIQAIWFDQKNLLPLYTSEGELIEVISPGIWNTEAGPDFLKAHLRIGHKEYKGDIELHLEEGSWYTHGHHLDERYNQVILHISFQRSVSIEIVKVSGGLVPAVVLEDRLNIPLEEILGSMDLELYPHKHFAEAGQCAHALFLQLAENEVQTFFKSAAYWRLEKKSEYLKSRIENPRLQLIAGIVMALGYKHNAEAFLDLFLYLFSYRDLSEKELLAIAMGCCGFFDGRQSSHWEKSPHYLLLRDLWYQKQASNLHQTQLKLDHIRPLNHPIRRLVYLTKLLVDGRLDVLWNKMLNHWLEESANLSSDKDCRKMHRNLMQLIPAYQDHYWNTHFIFEPEGRHKNLSLLGDNVRSEILVNAFLPLLYVCLREMGERERMEKFKQFYQSLKSLGTSKGRYLRQRFFANHPSANQLNHSQIEQGAYQLHKDFCLQFEASCQGCPFVARYLERKCPS